MAPIVSLGLLIALSTLVACGMDTPITPEASSAGWPFSITGAPLVTPTPAAGETLTPVRPSLNATFPDCAPRVEQELSVPANFPPQFPFPPQTKFFKVATLKNNSNYVEVVGYAPLPFKDSVRYLLDELPRAGYTLGRGDAEGAEAESFFNGNGWSGGFRINEIFYCPDLTEWVVIVFKF